MRRVKFKRSHALLVPALIGIALAIWLYANHVTNSDLSSFASADALGYVETNDLSGIASGITNTDAWKLLAAPIGAPAALAPSRWLVRLARLTGIGSTETVVLARSQVAIVLSGAEGAQNGSTLTIKPLTTFVIDTHTSQRRMRENVEQRIEELARRIYPNPVFVRKQIGGNDLQEWQTSDGSHAIILAFSDTVVILGNDETSVLHSLEAHSGARGSLLNVADFVATRQRLDTINAQLFGYIAQSGAKPLLQAFALYRAGPSADAVTAARLFSDTVGGLVTSAGWTSKFVAGGVEDRCSISLSEGVADKMRPSMLPDRGPDVTKLSFVPSQTYSLSLYQFRDTAIFWSDLNATVSSHTDLIGAVAARPILRALVKPYGIDDADTFARAIGPRIQTVRIEKDSTAVLIAEIFDKQLLRKAIALRFGQSPKSESLGDAELILAPQEDWAAAFVENNFVIGPAELVRGILRAHFNSQLLSSNPKFQKSQSLVDVSLPLTSINFSDDQQAAISFVESFTSHDRSAFAANAAAISVATGSLPFAVSVSLLKGQTLEWTSRSSFGIVGSLAPGLIPHPSSER